jgi:hypothetical protein
MPQLCKYCLILEAIEYSELTFFANNIPAARPGAAVESDGFLLRLAVLAIITDNAVAWL